jgi:hypothetical protein
MVQRRRHEGVGLVEARGGEPLVEGDLGFAEHASVSREGVEDDEERHREQTEQQRQVPEY